MLAIQGNRVQVGQGHMVTVLFTNDEGGQPLGIPDVVDGIFIQDEIEYPTSLTRVSSEEFVDVTPGAHQKVVYNIQVPLLLKSGLATLEMPDQYQASILLYVEIADNATVTAIKDVVTDHRDSPEAGQQDKSANFSNLTPYKPIYFIGGANPTDVKFQISLKYQLFNKNGSWATKNPWLAGLYLGYSQASFWSLGEESKPFEDTNFMPEVFYQVNGLRLNQHGDLDLQGGLLHESNGRDGLDSRSLNIVYGRATYEHDLGKEWFARLTGEAWSYVGSLEDNPDIADFRGHSSLQLVLGHQKGIQLSSYRRGPIGGGKSSYLFDLTVPVKRIDHKKNFNFTFHSQLFTGYGENLLTYNQKETRLRFGIGIHR